MNKIIRTTLSLIIVYFIYGIYINSYSIKVTSNQITSERNSLFNDYKGVINVHSKSSTGTGTHSEIFKAAENAQLRYVIFTDLNNFNNYNNLNYYQNKVLGITSDEYSFLDARVLVVSQEPEKDLNSLGQVSLALNDHFSTENFRDDKFTVLAHPTKHKFSWTGEYPMGLDGLEIINLKSLWQDSWLNKKITFICSFLIYPFNPELAFLRLFQRATEEIKIWDQLNQDRLRIAFAGSDAESRFNFFKTPLKFPSYETLFKIVSNHVLIRSELTGNYKKDQPKIFKALKKGQFYMSLDMIGDPTGFYFYGRSSQKNIYMGATTPFTGKDQLVLNMPKNIKNLFKIKLYKDSEMIQEITDPRATVYVKEPGTYKAIVFVKISLPIPEGRKWYPWVFTNAIKFE